MIKESNRIETPNWEENIQLEMSLADLQIIYDCIGAVPLSYLKAKHKNTNFEVKCYSANVFNEIYNELDEVVVRHNGITDNDANVNLDVELNMIGE